MSKELSDLESLRWENRILLIHSVEEEVDGLKASLRAAESEIQEREIVWFILSGKQIETNYSGQLADGLGDTLKKDYFDNKPGAVNVVLIGKDGGSKASYTSLDLDEIYRLIDSMPMRQAEMRREF